MPKLIDLTGKKFGRWRVLSKGESQGNGAMWNCLCECGTTRLVNGNALRRGTSASCGCTITKHGKKHTRLYNIWGGMKARCYRPTHKWYKRYGGRGITICDEWKHNFQAFYDWATANGYRDDLTIDRVDNDKGYSPDNCKWSTEVEQKNNRSQFNVGVEINGRTQTLAQWATEVGLGYQTIYRRYKRGDTGEDLIRPTNQGHATSVSA